jgi:[acyl-carrier-protein] S-malonyltransferase
MVSILGLDRDKIESLCREAAAGELLQVANLLCPGNIVVSGTKAACARIAEMAPAAGAMKAIPLAVTGAFHTSVMQPAVERLQRVLADVPLQKPRVPVIFNVDATPHDDPDEIRQLLVKQLVQPVLWEATVRYMLGQGIDTFYEVGPGRVLRGLLKRIDRKITCNGVMDE